MPPLNSRSVSRSVPAARGQARSTPRWCATLRTQHFCRDWRRARKDRSSLLERWRKDHGKLPLRPLQQKHVQGLISKLESPSVQRNMLRSIRHFTKFAVGAGLIDVDPAVSVTRAKTVKTGGYYTWTEEDVTKFEARHPVGSMARLALALYLNLGVRKSDVVRIGPRDIKDGILHDFLPQKGSRTGGHRISVRLFEETRRLIAATPVRLAHAGYSAPQIGAISGHKDLREVQLYIEQMNRAQMAIDTMTDFERVQRANENSLTE
jgi:integrase